MTGRKFVFAGTALLLALGLGACGEREQVIVYKQGKYQGKPDTKPWENDPAANPYPGSKWNKGDKSSWESAVRTRNLGQNEYTRAEYGGTAHETVCGLGAFLRRCAGTGS